MKFASLKQAEEFQRGISPFLAAILEDADEFARVLHGWELYITSLLRTPEENDALYVARGHAKGTHRNGVHVDGRGGDIRTRDVSDYSVKGLAGYLNSKYQYDPERPKMKVAVIEDGITAGSAKHLHCQVHPRTAMRPRED